jgi:glycosyltransferase involved in cell wall biosynthesis
MLLTNYFAMDPHDIGGGIGYRYAGLYGSLANALLTRSPESRVFWYSHADRNLRILRRKTISRIGCGMLKAVVHVILTALQNRANAIVIVGYHYAVPAGYSSIEYLLSLAFMKAFGCSRVRVVIDVVDPPVELTLAFDDKINTAARLFWRTMDLLTLKLANITIAVSRSYARYLAGFYRIERSRIVVVPCGSARYFKYTPPSSRDGLTVLYCGSGVEAKDVKKLVCVVTELREQGWT